MDIQVIVTTMHQKDMNKFKAMKLKMDTIIANQADRCSFQEETINGCNVKLATTSFRGTSRNRNLGFELSSSQYITFADDDMEFFDDSEKIIEQEFTKHPEADAIKFFVESKGRRELSWKKPDTFKLATRRDVSSAGVHGLVMKRECMVNSNIRFHEFFGPGTEYYCGEDTIFLQDLITKGIKLYVSPETIASIYQDDSTWFEGMNDKYYTVKGCIFACLFPKTCYIISLYSAIRECLCRSTNTLSFIDILKCYVVGIKNARNNSL